MPPEINLLDCWDAASVTDTVCSLLSLIRVLYKYGLTDTGKRVECKLTWWYLQVSISKANVQAEYKWVYKN